VFGFSGGEYFSEFGYEDSSESTTGDDDSEFSSDVGIFHIAEKKMTHKESSRDT